MLSFLIVITPEERDALSADIILLARGDESALERIYNICGGRLLSVAMGITRNLEMAKDVLQESFIRIVKYCAGFKGGNGYAWLCKVVRNTALTALKESGKQAGYSIDDFFNLSDGIDVGEQSGIKVAVNDALKQLKQRERTAVWLKYYNDMTVREIAAELGMARSTVFEMIKNAEHTLRKLLSD